MLKMQPKSSNEIWTRTLSWKRIMLIFYEVWGRMWKLKRLLSLSSAYRSWSVVKKSACTVSQSFIVLLLTFPYCVCLISKTCPCFFIWSIVTSGHVHVSDEENNMNAKNGEDDSMTVWVRSVWLIWTVVRINWACKIVVVVNNILCLLSLKK